jgi:hypothetical protein
MRLSLEHFEVHSDQLKMFKTESEKMFFKTLKQAVEVGRAYFSDDVHKVVYSYIGAYMAMNKRGKKEFCLGVSTRRAVYIRVEE